MTKTLKELQEEHPEWCFTCGKHWLKPGGIHTCHENPLMAILIAAKREDEKEIEGLSRKLDETFCEAHRQGSYLRDQLSAERQAHEETKRQLEDVDGALLAIGRILEPTLRASYAVWSYDVNKAWNDVKARQDSINRPTDKQPTNDRGEGEAK